MSQNPLARSTFKAVLHRHVRNKYQTDKKVEWWYTKFTAARRRRTARLSEQQNHRCCFCGRHTFLALEEKGKKSKWLMATMEHINPIGNGGSEKYENTAMSCDRCNNLRGTTDAIKFYEIMQDPIKRKSYLKNRVKRPGELRQRALTKANKTVFVMATYRFLFPILSPYFDAILVEIEKDEKIVHKAVTVENKTIDFQERFRDIFSYQAALLLERNT
jgi:5-methylcytosine-specific restriction endonuclease McrA